MECNKDEAARAKQIAEMKMKTNDFEGARKIALKAQNLYPELENISQLLSICDVHCSAQKSMGSEKDWYGILQVEKLADELSVKKQYRRLALFLHPDKNRFPGAEAAFKLICEANAVLSDPTKKSLYDSTIRVTVRSASAVPPPHHMNKSFQFNKQYGTQNNVSNGFGSLNQHQTTQTSFSFRPEVFCTSCPFCSLKYQCDRKFVNTMLRCQKCLKSFMGYEISGQGVPLKSKWASSSAQQEPAKSSVGQSSFFQEKGVPNQSKYTTGVLSGKGFSAHAGPQWSSNRQAFQSEAGARTEGKRVRREADNCNIKSWHGAKEGGTCNDDANNRKTRNLKSRRKRGRKVVGESSESYDTSSESDLEDVTIDPATHLNSGPSHVHATRRSSRKRQNISYNEDDGDDDYLPRPLKTSQGSKLSRDNRNEDGESTKNESLNGLATAADYSESDAIETETAYPEESLQGKSDKDTCECDDPEFNDFEKHREVSCFAVNQFWACYDTADGMPRFYAKVKKVCASPFELCITWLEADPADDDHKKWIDEELPVGCGTFKLGKTETTSSRLTFAHQVRCEKGKKRGSLIIHPREGEVWALFKGWDLCWSSEPENHSKYKYEVVEVLSDFDGIADMKVCYLDKVQGFVSLFQRSSQNGTESFMIRPKELYRFSHRILSFKMTGSEREGVPVGSFELDPASLPLDSDDLFYPGKAKTGTDNMDPGVNCVPPKSVKGELK